MLEEILEERVSGSCSKAGELLRSLHSQGLLESYDVELDREITLNETEGERVVRVLKGLTLVAKPFDKYRDGSEILHHLPSGSWYHFAQERRGGQIWEDETQNMYEKFELARLREGFTPKALTPRSQIGIYSDHSCYQVPDGLIVAKLGINTSQERSYDPKIPDSEFTGSLVVEGDIDELFQKVVDLYL